MRIALITLAVVVLIGGVLLLVVVVKFMGAADKAHGEALHRAFGAWTRVREFAQAEGKKHYIDEADENLTMIEHDLKAWRAALPPGTDLAALEAMRLEAYETTDRNIRNGLNPLAHLDPPPITTATTNASEDQSAHTPER